MSKIVSCVFSGLSSRVMGAPRGQAAPDVQVQCDLTGGFAQRLADQYHRAWSESPRRARTVVDMSSFDELLDVDAAEQRARTVAQEWTREVTRIIRGQAEPPRVSGRMLAGGINVVTASLMAAAFAMTGGLIGAEVGIVGTSTALPQAILEAYLGEYTVRPLVEQTCIAFECLAGKFLLAIVAPVNVSLDRASDRILIDKLAVAEERAREALV